MKKFFIAILLLCCILLRLSAQEKYVLNTTNKLAAQKILSHLKKLDAPDSLTIKNKLLSMGYLSNTIDSLKKDSTQAIKKVYITLGPVFKWVKLIIKPKDRTLLNSININTTQFNSKNFNIKNLHALFEKIVSKLEEKGYPFSTVKLKDVKLSVGKVTAQLLINKNNKITIDSLVIIENKKIQKLISNYTNIKPNSIYNEKVIKRSKSTIKGLSFVEIKKGPEIVFNKKTATVYYNLKIKKKNQFNGIVGLLTNETSGKVSFIGNLNLQLVNSLYKGERLNLKWEALPNSSQKLNVAINYPYFLNTPFGIHPEIKLFKQDTNFLNIDLKLGLFYLHYGNTRIEFYVSNKSSNIINEKFTTSLPEKSSTTKTNLGFSFTKASSKNLNFSFKGYAIKGNIEGGNKRIIKNPKINPQLYDNISINSYNYRLYLEIDYYLQLYSFIVLKLNTRGRSMVNNALFDNELYRIGGLNSLRGFDENSILANQFYTGEVETRFFLDKTTYMSLFFNQSYLEKSTKGTAYQNDFPYGFGAGISFKNKIGVFSLNYALGSRFNNPILFKAGKIHFGFISFF